MHEIQMTAAATRERLDRARQPPMLVLEFSEAFVAPMLCIDVHDHDTRNAAGHQSDIGVGPALEPRLDFVRLRTALLEFEPRHQRALAARLDRNHRPTTRAVRKGGSPRIVGRYASSGRIIGWDLVHWGRWMLNGQHPPLAPWPSLPGDR